MKVTSPTTRPDPFNSATYLLSTLIAARASGDAILERLVRDRLADRGVRIQFAGDLPVPAARKAVQRA